MLKSRKERLALSLGALLLGACSVSGGTDDTVGEHSQELSQGGVTSTLGVNDKWNSGYCATVTLANGSANRVTGWSVTLDLAGGSLSNLWSAKSSQSGSTLVVTPEAYNSSIASGSSTSFGFCVNWTSVPRITAMTVSGGGGTGSGGSVGTGGTSSSGGSVASGGAKTGGSSSGGAAAGGSSSGGTASGGTSTGGSGAGGSVASGNRPRVIHTTDLLADKDDEQSLVRQFVYANEMDLEGLVATTSCWRKTQDQKGLDKLNAILDAYGKALPNLRVHDKAFPSLEYLKSISVLGQTGYSMGAVGAGKDSPGSELIIKSADRADSRPLWVTCWGGCNTIAQAIWKVQQTRSPSELQKFLKKLRVYDVLGQDEAAAWMANKFPNDLFIIRAGNQVYNWQPSDAWVDQNVQSQGFLGAVYPEKAYTYEGDTPAILHLVPNGLHDPGVPFQGGWGGRFGASESCGVAAMSAVTGQGAYNPFCFYTDASEGGSKSIGRWKGAIENDFAARMDWSITNSFSGANHAPVAVLNGDTSRTVLEISSAPSAKVTLSAAGSSDPDNQTLSYNWFFYDEPSTYDGAVGIQGANTSSAAVTIPSGAAGKSIHVILEVRDSGSPALVSYRRVIIQVN